MKTCTTCKRLFQHSDFYKDKRKKDGLYPSCKKCHLKRTRRWELNNIEKARFHHRNWKLKNPNAYKKSYLKSGRSATLKRQSSEELQIARREYLATWRDRNRAKLRGVSSRWRRAHRDRVNDYTRIYRARKRTNGGTLTKQDWLVIKAKHNNSCALCYIHETYRPLTMDHIIPVLHGGETTKDNIQPLCKSCNSRKSSKYSPILAA